MLPLHQRRQHRPLRQLNQIRVHQQVVRHHVEPHLRNVRVTAGEDGRVVEGEHGHILEPDQLRWLDPQRQGEDIVASGAEADDRVVDHQARGWVLGGSGGGHDGRLGDGGEAGGGGEGANEPLDAVDHDLTIAEEVGAGDLDSLDKDLGGASGGVGGGGGDGEAAVGGGGLELGAEGKLGEVAEGEDAGDGVL